MTINDHSTAQPYDRDAIFQQDGPIDPTFIDEAIRALMRSLPLANPDEPSEWAHRRMYSALRALAALHPRDEIEVMLSVQAISAYHAAAACWYVGMNLRQPKGDSTRHLASAASAARAFDTLLKALERRQAKPLAAPIGRPSSRAWAKPGTPGLVEQFETRCGATNDNPTNPARDDGPAGVKPEDIRPSGIEPEDISPEGRPGDPMSGDPMRGDNVWGDYKCGDSRSGNVGWTPEAISRLDAGAERERAEAENKGLDLINTEGILPGGGMIMPENPTPQQAAYIARRLALSYKREYAENLRNGIKRYPKIRPLRTGDLVT